MIRFFTILIFTGLILSCDKRKEIITLSDVTPIVINIDWSEAGVVPDGASIWVFRVDRDDVVPKEIVTNSTQRTIYLKDGKYSFLVFNDRTIEYRFVSFRNTHSYETFEAYVNPIEVAPKYSKADDDQTKASSPSVLAADRLAGFEVNSKIINNEINFTPKSLTAIVSLVVHIEGIDNLANNGSATSISGMAEGVLLHNEELTLGEITHMFSINNIEYNTGSNTDGTLSGKLRVFGLAPEAKATKANIVSLFLKLSNNTDLTPPIERNVTDLIETKTENNEIVLNIEIGLGIEGDDKIKLPDVPTTDPDQGSGFDAEIDDWGESVIVVLPTGDD